MGVSTHDLAAPFQEQHVPPLSSIFACFHPPQSFPDADQLEAVLLVQVDAGLVLGKDNGLQGPETVGFGAIDQRLHQQRADAAIARRAGDIQADLGDADVDAARRDGAQSGPAENLRVIAGYQAAHIDFTLAPGFPRLRGMGIAYFSARSNSAPIYVA